MWVSQGPKLFGDSCLSSHHLTESDHIWNGLLHSLTQNGLNNVAAWNICKGRPRKRPILGSLRTLSLPSPGLVITPNLGHKKNPKISRHCGPVPLACRCVVDLKTSFFPR